MGKNSYTIIDSYEDYIKENESTPFAVDKETYKNICYGFNKKVSDRVISQTEEIKFPARLGTLRVKKIKGKNDLSTKKVNFKATREAGVTVYHLNDHTDGYHYRWFWSKKKAFFTHMSAYSFTATRANKRELARLLKLNEVDFFE